VRGSVYKRCPCGTTGTPGKPACRKSHGGWWWRAEAGTDARTKRRRQEHGSGYATRAEAEAALSTYLEHQRTGAWVDDQKLTVEAWLKLWLAESAGRLGLATLNGYSSHVRWADLHTPGDVGGEEVNAVAVEAAPGAVVVPGGAAAAGTGARAPVTKNTSMAYAELVEAECLAAEALSMRRPVPSWMLNQPGWIEGMVATFRWMCLRNGPHPVNVQHSGVESAVR